MTSVILVIHLILAIALVCIILLQRSEGGALGMGGGSGSGMGGFMSSRATADLLTRTTALIAAAFMVTSLTLAILASTNKNQGSIIDQPLLKNEKTPEPSEPSVPLAK
ncbi:MAG: preprotein translocase subunit SecG [Pseudomonadota bacterium]|nr:preprotein translocase subunit SecG [Pseudomonadota bacterium]|tara:strand:- start:11 stop:334 length:324 start_codon:yes stop_codon:yes gene_type:complete